MRSCVAAFPPFELALIPSGPAGVRATLEQMARIVRQYRKHPLIRQLAVELVRDLPELTRGRKDFPAQVRALWQFVRSWIRYVRDIRNVETLHSPVRLLKNRAGDCDDQAILLASLLEAIGHGTRFVAMGFAPGRYSHVLAETWLGGRWVPLETTIERPFGWDPPDQLERMVVNV